MLHIVLLVRDETHRDGKRRTTEEKPRRQLPARRRQPQAQNPRMPTEAKFRRRSGLNCRKTGEYKMAIDVKEAQSSIPERFAGVQHMSDPIVGLALGA